MQFTFKCNGHENILSLHRNTIEFTTAKELTLRGDCIVGVNADIDFTLLQTFIQKNKDKEVTAKIQVENNVDEFHFSLNPTFSNKHELVIRKGEFKSDRTIGIRADKAAKDLNRELVGKIKDKNKQIIITFIA